MMARLVIYGFLFVILIIAGCKDDEESRRKDEWVKRELLRKIDNFKIEKREECIAEIIIRAEAEVDSILSQKDLFGNVLESELPLKPTKPEFIPLDSSEFQNHSVIR